MTGSKNRNFYLGLCLFIWAAVWAVMASALPLLPIDETRYLTVAWEMRHSGNWILPSLNMEPYSHKPPMLFWLINLVWTITGPEIWAARIVPFLAVVAVLFSTRKLAKMLFPQDENSANMAPVFLLSNPAFMLYGCLIMFDVLMTVWVMLGLMALWAAAHRGGLRAWLVFGLALGLGILTKGPVILVYLLPVALLLPLWRPENFAHSYKVWYRNIVLCILMGAAIGLLWAVPAALIGGPEFSSMIFWKQSAGRMVNAFDHKRPMWFYLPIAILYCLPLLFWPALWRGMRAVERLSVSSRFLLSLFVSVFIIFSLMSSKQPHYLIPLIPALSLFILEKVRGRAISKPNKDVFILALPFILLFSALAALPLVLDKIPASNIRDGLAVFSPVTFMICGAAAVIILYVLRKTAVNQSIGVMISVALLLGAITLESSKKLYDFYDLRPLALAVQPYKNQPMAFVSKYAGEIGFLARIDRKMETMELTDLDAWFAAHPDGHAIIRHRVDLNSPAYTTLYEHFYKANQSFSIVEPKDIEGGASAP